MRVIDNNRYVEVLNLTKIYKNDQGIQDISFRINKGEVIGFVGTNGSGKTTTINLLLGLLKKQTGTILFNGLNDDINFKFRNKIGFVPDSNNLPKKMKIINYVAYVNFLRGNSLKTSKQEAIEILKLVGLEGNINDYFEKLSAGMQKRALLAAALIANPEFIILDEPTANLDVASRIEFINILKKLNESGITLLITSHIINELDRLISRLMIIKDGHLVYDNSFNKDKENIEKIYSKMIKNENKIDTDKLIDFKKRSI